MLCKIPGVILIVIPDKVPHVVSDDAGNLLTKRTYAYTTGTLGSESVMSSHKTASDLNPFRYRGYYYDRETGFYYLQSRYYDPATGRFLNADSRINGNGDIAGYNMYAYCSNNPMMCVDPTGKGIILTALIIGMISRASDRGFSLQ